MEREDSNDSDGRLPSRLYATDRYPKGRLNVYSKPDILSFVQNKLQGTEELEIIKSSSFGNLFNLPVSRLPISCQLIHSLLSRQLVTMKKYEMWTVFGGKPLRFSLAEFGSLTGLNCGEYPADYSASIKKHVDVGEGTMWEKFIGSDPRVSLADVAEMLGRSDGMPGWRRLGLALILIIDGVLIATHQIHKPTPRYVDMLGDQDAFINFPWGREAFLTTLRAMTPGKAHGRGDDPIDSLRQQLQQQSFSLKGFPLVLQLLAFKCIPQLLAKLPKGLERTTLLEAPFIGQGKFTVIKLQDVRNAEHDEQLEVTPMLQPGEGFDFVWAEWDGEVADKKVVYLEELIRKGHIFCKKEWPGGYKSLPPYIHKPTLSRPSSAHKRHIVSRKQSKQPVHKVKPTRSSHKKSSKRKQGKFTLDFSDIPTTIEDVVLWTQHKLDELKANFEMQLKKVRDGAKRRDGKHRRPTSLGFGRFSNPIRKLYKGYQKQHFVHPQAQGVPKSTLEFGQCSGTAAEFVTFTTPEANHPTTVVSAAKIAEVPLKGSEENTQGSEELLSQGSEETKSDSQGSPEASKEIQSETSEATKTVGTAESEDQDDCDTPTQSDHSADVSEEGLSNLINRVVSETSLLEPQQGMPATPLGEHSGLSLDSTMKNICSYGNATTLRNEEAQIEEIFPIVDLNGDDLVLTDDDLEDTPPASKKIKESISREELELGKIFESTDPSDPTILFPELDTRVYDLLQQYLVAHPKKLHTKADKFDFSNQFFLDLAKPQQWTQSPHMEALMDFLSTKHSITLQRERAQFASPWITQHIHSRSRAFRASKNKGRFQWSRDLKDFCSNREGEWLKDFDTIYAPMCWNEKHWVGVVINLKLQAIEVLDPNSDLYDDRKVDTYMGPIAGMLPYIVKDCTTTPLTQESNLTAFTYQRLSGTYKNKRGGDCGPLAVKLMEMHANYSGPEDMGNITDETVDIMRKQYALELFAHYIGPMLSRS